MGRGEGLNLEGLSNFDRNILYNVYPDRDFYARHAMNEYSEEERSGS